MNQTPFVDPQAAREQQKYENPVASRELIAEVLAAAEGPLSHMTLCQRLGLDDPNAIEALRRRLIAMERDGQLVSNRKGAYAVADKFDLVRGRVQGHRDGYGFVILQGGDEDIYLTNRQMRKVFDGDEVLVRKGQTDFRGRIEGAIIEVIASAAKTLVGRLYTERGINFLRADNPRIFQDILVPDDELGGAKTGQLVTLEVVDHPFKNRFPAGRVVEVLGEHLAPGVEIDVSIRSHNIPYIWPDEVTAEAAKISPQVLEADKEARIDLRHLPLVTIDGEDARDFDDAVFCEPKRGGGWRLYVAIADVAHYVAVASALDQEAQIRGNSVYFPDYVVPMLPEALSNGLCSLNPAIDRLCMVCEMTISAAGKITGFVFYESVMHSKARLTYNQVGDILSQRGEKHSELRQKFSHVVAHLDELAKLYAVLRGARDERGAIDFDTTETRIIFDDQRKIEKIIPVVRNDAHKLIEECMLAANVCAAKFLEELGVPALYRVHEPPKERKLELLKDFLSELGLSLRNYEEIKPADYQAIIQAIAQRPDASLIQTVLLRSMNQAVYSPENKGHFGLAYQAYTHFTSPIRRYPDLLTHRAIRSLVRSDKPSNRVRRHPDALMQPSTITYPYSMEDIIGIGEQCSLSERRADEATRDVVSWLKCEYLQSRVGEVFPGIIGAVVGFGLFVELSDLFVEGLVHISSLPQDYYHHQPAQHRLVGERSGRVFRLGDRLTVKVVRVSLDDRKVDFELVEHLGKSVPDSRSVKANKTEKKPKFVTNEQAVKANQLAQAERLAKLGGGKKKHKNKKKKLSKSERLAKGRGVGGDDTARDNRTVLHTTAALGAKDKNFNKSTNTPARGNRVQASEAKNINTKTVSIPKVSDQGAAVQVVKPSKKQNAKPAAVVISPSKVTKAPSKTTKPAVKTPSITPAKASAKVAVKVTPKTTQNAQSKIKGSSKTAANTQPFVAKVKKSSAEPQSTRAQKAQATTSPPLKNRPVKTTAAIDVVPNKKAKSVKSSADKNSASAQKKTTLTTKPSAVSGTTKKAAQVDIKVVTTKKAATDLKGKMAAKIQPALKAKVAKNVQATKKASSVVKAAPAVKEASALKVTPVKKAQPAAKPATAKKATTTAKVAVAQKPSAAKKATPSKKTAQVAKPSLVAATVKKPKPVVKPGFKNKAK